MKRLIIITAIFVTLFPGLIAVLMFPVSASNIFYNSTVQPQKTALPKNNPAGSNILPYSDLRDHSGRQIVNDELPDGKLLHGYNIIGDGKGEVRDSTNLWADAGKDSTLCINGLFFNTWGDAGNYIFLLWSTSGDGFFDNANNLNTKYYPGEQDMAIGSFKMYLRVWSDTPQIYSLIDSTMVSVVAAPFCNAGEDASVCENTPVQLDAQAQNHSALLWSTTGDGYFSNATQLNPLYFPGNEDIEEGNIVLCLVAYPFSPCTLPEANCMTLEIEKMPLAEAGNDTLICETEPLHLEGYTENYDSLYWTTTGDGIFSDPSIPDPYYFPGDEDLSNGTVVLQLTATANEPCLENATDELILIIQRNPTVTQNSETSVCLGEPLQLQASATHYANVLWVTYGDGSFDDPTSLTPFYTPGELDNSHGYAFIELNVYPVSPCTWVLGSYLLINILPEAEVTAGTDTAICAESNITLSALATNFSSLEWTTSGDGYFDNPNILKPTYYPGNTDKQAGEAILQINANSNEPCQLIASDYLTLTLSPQASAFAGEDVTACSEILLQGTAANNSSILWSTTGDGQFSDPTIADPVYVAGEWDIENQFVELVLTALPVSPCEFATTDTLGFFIDVPEIIGQQMTEQVLYAGDMLELSFEAESLLEGSYQWYLNGEFLAGFNNATLQIQTVNYQHAGVYSCIYSNGCIELYSDTAMVVVYRLDNQEFLLREGWSGMSSFIQPENPDISALFEPILEDMEILTNEQGVFWPGENLNTINDWFNNYGYRIKMNDTASLNFTGLVRFPPAPLEILPGWSLFPVTSTEPIEIEAVFGNMPGITMIKEVAGTKIYWPSMGIFTLDKLEPGKSYQILNGLSGNVLLTFPPGTK